MKKLNKNQQSKFDTIKTYLSDYNTDNYILIGDQDVTYGYELHNIFFNASGLNISTTSILSRKKQVENLDNSQITQIYRAMLKEDSDFKYYVENM